MISFKKYFCQRIGFDISCKLSPIREVLHEISSSIFLKNKIICQLLISKSVVLRV